MPKANLQSKDLQTVKKGLTNNQLKVIALIAMTIDHIGVVLFPDNAVFRIVGRLAFPIFAYMIAEGCKYTRNRKRYLSVIACEALVCQLVYIAAEGSLYMNIFVTLALSISLIYLCERAVKERKVSYYAAAAAAVAASYFICETAPNILGNTDFMIDYGFVGVLTLVVIYFTRDEKRQRLASAFIMCVLLSLSSGNIQYFCVFSVVLLALYNGQRGKRNIKYLFYVYYPLHLAAIYLISLIIQ